MFTYEEKIKAVELYLKSESWTFTIRTLGYPSLGHYDNGLRNIYLLEILKKFLKENLNIAKNKFSML